MALKLFNSMGKKLEEFVPITPGYCGFYGCGPTVYNYAHIGNLRAYVFLDILDKTLTYLGYKIKHVMNITDIGHLSGDSDDGEDKMVKTAAERHQSVMDIANFYTEAFFKDIDRLNIRHPDVVCRATEHVAEMIELIKRLEANGHTYMAGGNLYYDTSTFKDYGKLADLKLDELQEGAGRRKVVVVDDNKRNPTDFVLWFTKSKFENQALVWDSPWGKGYPGWHIECSAMSMKYLGEHFDIHTGGIDHIPVHHTNEIAQSEGATNSKWVNYWLHNEFLVLAGATKMSKSSGNFLTLQSIIDKGFDALDYRLFLLGAHYRKQVFFSWEALEGTKAGRKALVTRTAKVLKDCDGKMAAADALSAKAKEYLDQFKADLENDLNTPQALSRLQVAIKDQDLKPEETLAVIAEMDSVLGLNLIETAKKADSTDENSHEGDPEAAEIDALVQARVDAKKAKDFEKADKIRNELQARGIIITDTPNGPVWKRS
ncbi:MAG: cysteine--tRNA ligase [Treponema sp.]|nr:cysteine--tRNA ligase [Treponema sp.]